MNAPEAHDMIVSLRKAIADGRVEKAHAENFNRWRLGTKCNLDPALRAAADVAWEQMQSMDPPRPPPPPIPVAPARESRVVAQPKSNRSAASGTSATASAQLLGEPFHNPYTFLPFGQAPKRHLPTPLSADELETERFTGIIELDLVTLSPLLTCSPTPHDQDADHKRYRALCIGSDVIVPATGIRGALRSLMTILTGGTLGYLDEEIWLCQGRDLNLGPAGERSPAGTPNNVFLAAVVRPGSITRSGTLRLGETRLIQATKLEQQLGNLMRPQAGRQMLPPEVRLDGVVGENVGEGRPWKVKLSGRPVNPKGKREGLFMPDTDALVVVPPDLWSAFHGRNAHGDHPELRAGDLVWLEAKAGRTRIASADDIESLQWARWGRRGERLLDVVKQRHRQMLPDSINPDGLVDEVTDLFGQVPRVDLVREAFINWTKATAALPGPAGPFAARVRPENLVFRDAATHGLLKSVALAPLAPPHPGCAAFYRDQDEPTLVANGRTGLRGYKVYRTTGQHGDDAPWRFAQQAVYDERGGPKPPQQKVNKTVDLLQTGHRGTLRIACRSLTAREVALLMAACSVDWRLGGGKPLGLGHCRVTRLRLLDESGAEVAVMHREGAAPARIPDGYGIDATLRERILLWQASQEPVAFLRYPRAVNENHNKKSRGGHVWFARHANPRKKMAGDGLPDGLEVMYVGGELAARSGHQPIAAQVLPRFDADRPMDDVLFGYDLFIGQGDEWAEQASNRQTFVKKIEPFDPKKHARAGDRSGDAQGQDAQRRREQRGGR